MNPVNENSKDNPLINHNNIINTSNSSSTNTSIEGISKYGINNLSTSETSFLQCLEVIPKRIDLHNKNLYEVDEKSIAPYPIPPDFDAKEREENLTKKFKAIAVSISILYSIK